MTNQHKCRYIKTHGTKYLRIEDVCDLLREFGGSEEIDVRNRINELIRNLTESKDINGEIK
jgi:hypothetical protein